MTKCWIVGPIAWDFPYRLPYLPGSGQFVQAEKIPGRLGGTGANVARALASRHAPVGMIGYIGQDRYGAQSVDDLRARGIDASGVQSLPGDTSQVLLFIEPSGERTIVGLVPDCLHQITISTDAVSAGDLVYFAGWREEFEPFAKQLAAAGAIIASVPFDRPADTLPVAYVIGSTTDLSPEVDDVWATYNAWTGGALRYVVLTRGAQGAQLIDERGCETLSTPQVEAVDVTGAGDSFAAAMLAAIQAGLPPESGIRDGLLWGAATVQSEGSIPPPWADIS